LPPKLLDLDGGVFMDGQLPEVFHQLDNVAVNIQQHTTTEFR
jgi:hypothetical protein